MRRYRDRYEGGERLADGVAALRLDSPLAVGLARGGVAVAAALSERLGIPFDVLVVRKIGVPWQPELGMGAVAEGGDVVLNNALIAEVGVRPEVVDEVRSRAAAAAEEMAARFRVGRPPLELAGRAVVIVDDGLATGSTARAAVAHVRRLGAAFVAVAVPVGAPDTVEMLAAEAEAVVCPLQPPWLMGVGAWYEDFSQVSDEEVVRLLTRAGQRPADQT